MRQRNYFLALVLLALFGASGVLYFRVFVEPRKAFGVILFVGEGLVTSKLTAARLYAGGAGHRLAMDSLSHVALLRTSAADSAVPDAASAASALSCGAKVNRRALCVDPVGRPFPTLLQLAADHHRATGLITTGRLTDPTPAAFYAHAADCQEREDLAVQMFTDSRLQVILGGGAADLVSKGKSLVDPVASAKLYKLLRTPADLQATFGNGPARLLGLFAPEAMPYHDQVQAADASRPGLPEMVAAAIDTLQRQRNGYVLVVDAGLVERASLENQAERALQELVELDRAVGVALQYAGPQSLVIVAGGQSTGGMALNGEPSRQEQGGSLLKNNANGQPPVTWATGPAGPTPNASPAAAPAAWYAPLAANVADDAVAAASGPGSEQLQGFKENTFVFDLIRGQL